MRVGYAVVAVALMTVTYIGVSIVRLEFDYETTTSAEPHSLKGELWKEFNSRQDMSLDQHQYCMLWCPDDQLENVSEWDLYRDLTPEEAEKLGSYYTTENRDIYQTSSMEYLNVTCCQVATRKSFNVIYDTRHSDDLGKDVTLITFGTFDRLTAVLETKRRWIGPMVVVLYVSDYNDPLFSTLDDGEHLSSKQVYEGLADFPVLDNLLILTYNASYRKDRNVLRMGYNAKYFNATQGKFDSSLTLLSPEEALKQQLSLIVDFPINSLRNVAQDFAQTRYVLALDLDFIPDVGAYNYLRSSVEPRENKVAILLPHFETNRKVCLNKSGEYDYPLDFESLRQQFKSGLARPCRISLRKWAEMGYGNWTEEDLQNSTCSLQYLLTETVAHTFLQGVHLVNFPKWFELSSMREQKFFEISHEDLLKEKTLSFEPYFMVDKVANSTDLLARYNELFMNRRKDKASWTVHLKLSGYRFYVGVGHFIIHQDHKPSSWTVEPDKDSSSVFWRDERFVPMAFVYEQTLKDIYG
jgi:hypothetical protein